MKLIRNYDNCRLEIVSDNEEKILELEFVGDEFSCLIYTNKPIVISKDIDEYLFDNINWLMNNNYTFYNNLSSKSENEIIWFSDQYCNLEDKEQTNMINRLVIKQIDDKFNISYINPFYIENNIIKNGNYIFFSPGGNGQYNKNNKTGYTFQDDFIKVFQNTLYKKKINNEKKLIKKKSVN